MEFLSAIVTKILEYTVQPVGHQLGYLFHYGRNVGKLKDELDALVLHKDRIIHKVDAARRNGEEIYKDVQDWLNRADSVISEEDKAVLLNDENPAKRRCSSCEFPNLVLRYKLSKQAKEIANRVSEIKVISFETVAYHCGLVNSIVVNKDYKGFATRKPVLDEIMKALKSPHVSMIGMYGIGGVGKTTLAKEIARQAKEEEKLFDKVITVIVSQTIEHEKIQSVIAGQLGLEFANSETDKSTRAIRLRQRLSKETKILIILDDVWEPINLFDDVGIHVYNGQNGCKILMTSRRLALFKSMDVKERFCVETLTEDEATELFCSVVGDLRERPDCKRWLNELVSECGGLPLVINTVAAALKDEPSYNWKNALNEMKKSAPENIDHMIKEVYPRLRMSYNFLNGEAQSLLLICSMFPEDTLVSADDLLMYSVVWGLLNHVKTLEDARYKLYTLIDTLRKNCLLLPSDKSPFDKEYHWVKVHDVIRDVSISIASEKGWFNISSITQLEEWSSEENLKVPIAISLLGNFARQLPDRLFCPQLQSFIVPSRFNKFSFFELGSLPTIPDCFFEENKKMIVLDLSRVCLKSPPSSLSCLVDSLQTLRLIGCNLEDTTFIGGLKKLKCLDLSFSKFEKLSKEIGQLTRLKLLALDYCRDLKVIEPAVISSLIRLEELYMREVKIKWEVESNNNGRHNASLAELKNLLKLNTLCIRIEEADVMPKDLFTEKLKRYEIIVGQNRSYNDISSCSKVLDLELPQSSVLSSSGLEKLIEESEDLRFRGLDEDVVCKRQDEIEFPKLRSLTLWSLPKLVQFSRSSEWETASSSSAPSNSSLPLFNQKVAFPMLEKLELSILDSVQTLWPDNLSKVPSMQNLKILSVSGCDSIKCLFSFAMARSFVQLKELTVRECEMMEEVLVIQEAAGEGGRSKETTILFPQLESLQLSGLWNLKRFYRGDLVIECPSLRHLKIEHCTEDVEETEEPLLSEKVAFPCLEELEVEKCERLKYLLSYDMARSLTQLQSLTIEDCRIMEVVVFIKEPLIKDGRLLEKISFSKLEYVKLYLLPSLKRFYSFDRIECPSLKQLTCHALGKSIVKDDRKVEERKLEPTRPRFTQKVAFSNSLTMLLQLSKRSFKNLLELKIYWCHNLEYLFPLHSVGTLSQLKHLMVWKCNIIEQIVIVTKEEREEGSFKKISFPKLESLKLEDLPRLKRFCAADCIECDSLLELEISNCPELRTFIANSAFRPTLTAVEEEIGKRDLVAQQPMLNEKVAFPRLEKLEVKRCESLKYLLSYDTARSLTKLQSLGIWDCKIMEVVVVIKEPFRNGRLEQISFSKLEYVELSLLPNLERFSSADCIECPSLKKLDINGCHGLGTSTIGMTSAVPIVKDDREVEERKLKPKKDLFTQKVAFSNSLMMLLQLSGTSFKNLVELQIIFCENLKYLFPLHSVERLSQLKKLIVKLCKVIEEVVVITKEEREEGSFKKISFPKLESLKLQDLPKLKRFCAADCIECDSLLELEISNCPELRTFIANSALRPTLTAVEEEIGKRDFVVQQPMLNEKVSFPNLETLEVKSCGRLKTLLMSSSVTFQNLGELRISKYDGMINVLASSTVKCLVQLKTMSISECDQMTEIIVDKQGEAQNTEIAFTQLETLALHRLPTLKSFYCGNSNIRFPNLKKVIVSECPQMENFSGGTVITSKLNTVISKIKFLWDGKRPEYAESIEEVWKDDLNTSVRTIRDDLNAQL